MLRVDLLREVPATIPAEVEAEASMVLAFLIPGSGARVEVRSAASATLAG